jgi:hypothetical protein
MYQFPESTEEIKMKFPSDILWGQSTGFLIAAAVNPGGVACRGGTSTDVDKARA